MNVGFLCAEYPSIDPHHGGIGSAVQTLAHALCDAGHGAKVFSLSDDDGEFEDGPVRGVRLRRASVAGTTLRTRRRLRGLLSEGALDVIEAPETEAHLLPGGPGSVVRMNGSHHFWCEHLDQRRRRSRLLLEQWGIRGASGLCAVSRFAADETVRLMRLGRREVEILPNPVDIDLFCPDPEAVVPGRVVFVGTVTRKKGIVELCQAIASLAPESPHAHLVVLGRDDVPEPEASLRARILEDVLPELRHRFDFRGAQPRQVVAQELRTAQVCAFPSYMETQGIVVAEALASGRPAIASSRGPGPETLGDPPAGWLVDPRSVDELTGSLRAALNDAGHCDTLGRRGRIFVEESYSSARLLEKTLAFYRRHSTPR